MPTGCSSGQIWFKPNVSLEQMTNDLNLCRAYATIDYHPSFVEGENLGQTLALRALDTSLEDNRQDGLVRDGMRSLGYRAVKKSALSLLQTNTPSFSGDPKNDKIFIKSLQRKAMSGDVAAEYMLGNCYAYGTCGVQQNPEVALNWIRYGQAQEQAQRNGQLLVTPNAYGLGVNSDQYGRPQTYRLQNGQQLDPIFQNGVKPNAYGLGVGMDQFGRPVYNSSP
jgi:TPR repeat protein